MSSMFIFNRKRSADLSLWITMLLIVLFPLFKGGNYPGAMSVFLLAMLLVFLLSFKEESNKSPKPWFIVWFIVTLSVIAHSFIFPLFLSSERFFVGGLTPDVFSLLGSGSLSKFRVLEVWSYFSAMWIFVWKMSIASPKQLVVLMTALFFASSFQALFGVVHFISGGDVVLGLWTKEYYLGDATGTFVNRNHFSGMLAIASPLVLSGLLGPRPLILPSISKSNRLIISALYMILIMLAFINSHSRMGMAAGLVGLFVCLFLLIESSKGYAGQKKSALKIVGSIFLFLFLFVTWFGFADIMNRYAELSDGNSRLDVWKAMFSMPLDVWLFGIGPGQFEDVFQVIKPNYFSARFVYAHNDYLEFVFEFGLLCSLIILAAFIFWFKLLRPTLGHHPLKSGVFGAFSAIALHSLVDFNLQVPASALCFCFALGVWVNSGIAVEVLQKEVDQGRNIKKVSRSKLHWPKNKREWLAFLRSE